MLSLHLRFAFSNNVSYVFLLIYFSCNSQLGYKIFASVHATSKNQSSSESLKMFYCRLCFSVYLHSSTYAWGLELTLLLRCNVLPMEVSLDTFFPSFHLTLMYLPSPFEGDGVSFSKNYDSTPVQIFRYWSIQSLPPKH